MFERPRQGERAVLVALGIGAPVPDESIQEFEELARSAGAEVCATLSSTRKVPQPRYLIGRGKLEELRDEVRDRAADLVLFDRELSPSQERNLEAELKCRVLDRAGLILDIFAQRARSFEGKLQVELAQLRHLSTRLVRGWTHLERQKGGIGLRGPGETQLETDRRLIGRRIRQLNERLIRVRRQRDQGRRTRRRAELPTVSLIGYTNAGKSTLFNSLTDASVHAADQLFATLDPTLRRVDIGGSRAVILADTVGFIRDLPHELVAAFHSTLQETREAALLLHVVDAADPNRRDRIEQVAEVISEIGANEVGQLEVFNKIDLAGEAPRITRGPDGRPRRVWVSAETGAGLDLLLDAVRELVSGPSAAGKLRLGPDEGRLRARLFEAGAVVSESQTDDGGWLLEINLSERQFARMCREAGIAVDRLEAAPCAATAGFLQSGTVA